LATPPLGSLDLELPRTRALLAFWSAARSALAGAACRRSSAIPWRIRSSLGLSGGAGAGAVLADRPPPLTPARAALPIVAFIGALAALGLVYRLGSSEEPAWTPASVASAAWRSGAFAAAITTAIVSLADAAEAAERVPVAVGRLSSASWIPWLLVALYAPIPWPCSLRPPVPSTSWR